jgi:hypothetical protein
MDVELSAAEWRAVELWRKMGFGTLALRIEKGEPREWEAFPRGRCDKPAWPGVEELLRAKITDSE